MGYSTRIKICGVTDPDQAIALANMGVDYIGMIFHPASPRSLSVDRARAICDVLRASRTHAVAVLVDQDAQQMREIIDFIGVNVIQLHGDRARAMHHLLPDHLQRVVALSFKNPLPHYQHVIETLHLFPSRDYLLFDSIALADNLSAQLTPFRSFPFFLAGGIHPENSCFYRDHYHPYAIDVASSVESTPGIKDLALVRQLINTLRNKEPK